MCESAHLGFIQKSRLQKPLRVQRRLRTLLGASSTSKSRPCPSCIILNHVQAAKSTEQATATLKETHLIGRSMNEMLQELPVTNLTVPHSVGGNNAGSVDVALHFA